MMDMQQQSRFEAFKVFDLDRSGVVCLHDLQPAFQACAGIGVIPNDRDFMAALRMVGVLPGSMVSFQVFTALCDALIKVQEPVRQAAEQASALAAHEAEAEKEVCQRSPRRTTRSAAPATEYETRGDDFEWLHGAAASHPPEDLPASPRGPRACLAEHPGMDPVAHAFFSFDMDNSGAVSGVELPRMLRMVRTEQGASLGRPGETGKGGGGGQKAQDKWDAKIRECLARIGKEYSDLLNLHDFQAIVDQLMPPPVPKPPPDDAPKESASERRRREEAEERQRRLEEATKSWEAEMEATLVVKLEDGSLTKILGVKDEDKVVSVMQLISESPGHSFTGMDPDGMRLIGRGFDMDKRKTLKDYGVVVGAPWSLVPVKQDSPVKPPYKWKNGDLISVLRKRAQPVKDEGPAVVSGDLLVRLSDGSVIYVPCEDDEPLEYIMRRIAPQIHAPPSQQRLIALGRELNPRKALRDYGIKPGSPDGVDIVIRDTPAEPGHGRPSPGRVRY
eukprot:Hpha_TRINITY_DN15227_c1_g3::TRINITY_DN15227_c1_g3_i1::g.65221::m.65221